MAVFLFFTLAGTEWEKFYPSGYVVKTILTAVLLIIFWKRYTKIRWDYWWLGAIVGAPPPTGMVIETM